MMKLRTSAIFAATLALTMGLLVGCVAPTPAAPPVATAPPAATPTVPPATPTAPVENTPEPEVEGETGTLADTGMGTVENVEVRILESFPVQVQAVVTGYLPDGCTTIRGVEVVKEGSAFRILITTNRPADAMCTMAIVRFEQVVPLDVAELPAGTYQVLVNDLAVEFELPGSGEAATLPTAGDYPVVETTTAYVMAQADVPMFDAPMAGASEIGMIAGGQMARVTGASPDGAWWRVICPDDTVGDCWVTAAPDMTVPATPPN